MRLLFLSAILVLWASFCLNGQDKPCGYTVSEPYYKQITNPSSDINRQISFLKQYQVQDLLRYQKLDIQSPGNFKLVVPQLNGTGFNRNLYLGSWIQNSINETLSASNPRIIPIVAHIVRRNDKSMGLKVSELNAAIAKTNEHYRPLGMRFVVCQINFINDSGLADTRLLWEDHNAHTILNVRARNRSRKLNIYFVPNSDTSWAPYPSQHQDSQHIVMNNRQAKNGTTLSHEIGHWFGLIHTHGRDNDVLTDELVNGSNCDRSGDGICDTPADPKLNGRITGSCQYVSNSRLRDANGQQFRPDPSNLMSYAGDCRTTFSREQLISMLRAYFRMSVERGYTFSACNDSGTLLFIGKDFSFHNYYGLSKQGVPAPLVDAKRRKKSLDSWAIPIRLTNGVNTVLHYNRSLGTGTILAHVVNWVRVSA